MRPVPGPLARWLLAVLSLILLGGSLLAFLPEDYWIRSQAPLWYKLDRMDQRVLILWWSNDLADFRDTASISNAFFLKKVPSRLLVLKENKKDAWGGLTYVDDRGRLFRELSQYGRFEEVPKGPFGLGEPLQFDHILYDRPETLERMTARLPVLRGIRSVERFEKGSLYSGRRVWRSAPRGEWAAFLGRLVLYGICLGLLWAFFWDRMGRPGPDFWARAALAGALAVASILCLSWAAAECLLWGSWGVTIPLGLVLGAWAWSRRKTWSLGYGGGKGEWVQVLLLFCLCQYWVFAHWRFTIDGDIWRYFQQGAVLGWGGGWKRDAFEAIGRNSSLACYPYGLGLLLGAFYGVLGTPQGEWLQPGWRFSVVYFLVRFFFGCLNSIVPILLFGLRGRIGLAGSLLGLAAFFFLDSSRGIALGGENLYWPLWTVLFLVAGSARSLPDFPRLGALFLLGAAASLCRQEYILDLFILLLLPMALLRGSGVLSRVWVREAGVLSASALPLLVLEWRNGRMGLHTDTFLPVTLGNLRENAGYLGPVLGAETSYWVHSGSGFLCLAALVYFYFKSNIPPGGKAWIIFVVLSSLGVFTSATTGVYLLSDYVSKLLHVDQSYYRFSAPAFLMWVLVLSCWTHRDPSGQGQH